ncbi:MAG: glutamate racemase [Marinifilaceae bacterium]
MSNESLKRKSPIGVFDSGYGGLTILKGIVGQLPGYDYLYLGDNARAPYGSHSFELVYKYTLEAVRYLFSQGCELVIIACNTASAKALRSIQQNDLPNIEGEKRVLGVIRPSVEVLDVISENKHVGVMATRGTVQSDSYKLELDKLYGTDSFVVSQLACPMLVPIVENNEINTLGAEYFVKRYVDELMCMDKEIDTVVLGCTHYPLLSEIIGRYLPRHVKMVKQGDIVASSLDDYLNRHPEMKAKLSTGGTITYQTTENAELFDHTASLFMGKKIKSESIKL